MSSSTGTYLALFLGGQNNPKMADWNALPEAERMARQQEGLAAWKAWMEKHKDAIVGIGGPLGKTKRVGQKGVEDVRNAIGGYTIVRAASHEAAAKMFEKHPQFTIFPGEAVEIMPILPVPGT